MIRILFIVACTLIALLNQAFAQQTTIHIQGAVLNEAEEALEGATVYLMTTNSKVLLKSALTDAQGHFKISHVPNGNYYLEVGSIGYASAQSAPFEFAGKPVEMPSFILTTESQTIEAVAVTGQQPLIRSSNGKLIMDVENSTLAAGNNALEVLQRAPGVTIDKDENILLMGREGINVTIDGRQTFMTGDQLASFLKSVDGGQIKNIEVATTRSAKDDAEGSSGSINIVLKKNKIEGFNGTLIGSLAQGNYARGNTSASLNYKKNNTTLFGTYSYLHNKRRFDLDIYRIVGLEEPTAFDQTSDLYQTDKAHTYRFGIEQKTSERNTLLAQFSANNSRETEDNVSFTEMSRPSGPIDSMLNSNTYGRAGFNRYSLNLNNTFLTDTSGGKLVVDADLTRFRNTNTINYEYLMSDAQGSLLYDPEFERSAMPVDIDIYVGRVDYSKPFKNQDKFETGLKYSNVRSDNNMQFEHRVDGVWQEYAGRPNHFIYTEQVAAAYADYSREINKWSIKAGLRGELTMSNGESRTMESNVKRRYFDLFPSASVTRTLNENNIISLSYAKKISRPNYRFLNPFEYFIDRFTFMRGNPYLQPQYTHGFSLNYTWMKMFNFTLGSDITNDAITESMGQDEETKQSWVIRENLGRQVNSYLNINTPYKVGNFWSINNNMTLVHMYFKGPIAGSFVDQGGFMFQLNNMNNFKINKSLSAETSLAYTSPFVYNIYKIHSRWNLDVGVNYTFKDPRSTLKLAATDIFRTSRNNISTNFGAFLADIRQYNDTQTVRLTYTFRFGNLKQNIRKSDGGNDERDRAQ
ncbi:MULTISPECIES: outer membrane beta-barrel protein [Sphingobacterium]|uniref:Outer membrane beta-barrel protein n=1 Tax=Sphingobacterium populi TaxID=1812824 RepID=A0ABW5UB53_9SPHI|nr:outer membrane beta-barrel protein [Sphingobacterium sp. CFCC 11742]